MLSSFKRSAFYCVAFWISRSLLLRVISVLLLTSVIYESRCSMCLFIYSNPLRFALFFLLSARRFPNFYHNLTIYFSYYFLSDIFLFTISLISSQIFLNLFFFSLVIVFCWIVKVFNSSFYRFTFYYKVLIVFYSFSKSSNSDSKENICSFKN